MAEKYYHISPYAYCAGNPVNVVDTDGNALLKVIKVVYKVGKKVYKAYRNSEKIRLEVTLAEEVYSIVDDAKTLSDPEAQGFQKGLALIDLATGFGEEAKVGLNAIGVSERVFTKTSRRTLQRRMKALNGGAAPAGKQAHHMLPWEHVRDFEKAGIDINDPQYGIWLETHEHLSKNKEYNARWAEFFKEVKDSNKKLTAEEIVAKMKQLMYDIYGKVIE